MEWLCPHRHKVSPRQLSSWFSFTKLTHYFSYLPAYPPERNAFGNAYTSAPPTPYYTQSLGNQPAYQNAAPNEYRPQPPEPITQKPQFSARPTTQLPEVSNIDLAINEYELGQNNNRFEEHNKVKHSTTPRPEESARSNRRPASRTREESTTARGRIRTRGRQGSSRTTSTTTPAPVDPDRYTVLEEFSAREVSTESYASPSSTAASEAPRRSPQSFSGSRYLPEEAFDTTRAQSYDNTRVELQPPKHDQFEALLEPPSTPKQYLTEVENIPANVYSLGQPTNYEEGFEPSRTPSSSPRPLNENVEETTSARVLDRDPPTHRFGAEGVSYENREPNQGRATYANSEEAAVLPQSDNLFQPNFDQTYISLQDQAVRSLLVPNLLAPGTSKARPISSTETLPPTTEEVFHLSSSTEPPTTTTSVRPTVRTRGRGRPRPTSAAATESPTRRTPSRRRPSQPPSTERVADDSGEYVPNVQRFRARTRPTQNDIVERPSTTEAYQPPALEVAYEPIKSRASSTQPPPSPYEELLVVTLAPNPEPEIREYSRVFTTTPQPVLDYENTRTRAPPLAEVPEQLEQRRFELGARQSDEVICKCLYSGFSLQEEFFYIVGAVQKEQRQHQIRGRVEQQARALYFNNGSHEGARES